MTQHQFYHFGCANGSTGHYLRESVGSPYRRYNETPWGNSLDGGLLDKKRQQVQGEAVLHHKDGWTALAFWDRSVDKRPGSNSVFLSNGTHDFEMMLRLAKILFPAILERFDFPIVLVKTHG